MTTDGVHEDQGVANEGVGFEPEFENPGMKLASFMDQAQLGIGTEDGRVGEPLGLNWGVLEHVAEEGDGLEGHGAVREAPDDCVPGEGVWVWDV